MSLWCEAADLPGFAAFFNKQCGEEAEHTEKLYRYLLDLGIGPCPRNLARAAARNLIIRNLS